MKLLLSTVITLSTILFSMPVFSDEIYSIYLVRHAEKQQDVKNPQLTNCGRFRAQQLASLLANVDIKAIYSTQYQRTMATAQPISHQKNLAIKNYSGKNLTQFALSLKQLKQNALVVGHSNTTPQLAELLSSEKVKAITEKQYQGLYQIQFFQNQVSLTLLTQPLVCR